MLTAKINFTDRGLFGNDAAEDEEEDIFKAYAIERPEVEDFIHPSHKIKIVRAYKGEGKSAIIRLARNKLLKSNPDCIVVSGTGSSFSPDDKGADIDAWVRGWKEKIFRHLASEIGTRIGMAFTDDAMSLVEEAEKNSFKSKNFISAVADRFRIKHVDVVKQGTSNPETLLQRWMREKPSVWLFVDDVDQNFQNTTSYRAKVTSFLAHPTNAY